MWLRHRRRECYVDGSLWCCSAKLLGVSFSAPSMGSKFASVVFKMHFSIFCKSDPLPKLALPLITSHADTNQGNGVLLLLLKIEKRALFFAKRYSCIFWYEVESRQWITSENYSEGWEPSYSGPNLMPSVVAFLGNKNYISLFKSDNIVIWDWGRGV